MNKKTAIITGASRGIGWATAKLLAENNFNVIINYLNSYEKAVELEKLLLKNNLSAATFKADVSDYEEVKKMAEFTYKNFSGIDVLVNNAGIALPQGVLTDVTSLQWESIFNINVKGCFNCCKAVIPYMLKKHSGKIINVSSIWGICGASCEVPYSASKAAVIGFTKALAKELGPSGINVNCVAPGVINTDMNAHLNGDVINSLIDETPLEKLGSPEDIAQTIGFLASENASFITGQVISPNGGFVI